LLDLNQMI